MIEGCFKKEARAGANKNPTIAIKNPEAKYVFKPMDRNASDNREFLCVNRKIPVSIPKLESLTAITEVAKIVANNP